jgi:hypothetical protein
MGDASGGQELGDGGEDLDDDDPDAQPPSYRTTVEEVEDEDAGPPRAKHQLDFEKAPGVRGTAGKVVREEKTEFEKIRDDQILTGAEVLGPFKDDAEWELAKLLIKKLGHSDIDAFLKLDIVSPWLFKGRF